MGQKIKPQTLVRTFTKYWWIYRFYISQGKLNVAMQLRCEDCGGMFSNRFITNFLQNVQVKKIENRSILGKDMDKSLCHTFLDHHIEVII